MLDPPVAAALAHLIATGNGRVLWFESSRLGAGNRPTMHHSTAAVLLQAGSSRQRWYTKSPFISAGCTIAHVRGFNADNALSFSNEPEVSGPSPASSSAHHGTRALISVLVSSRSPSSWLWRSIPDPSAGGCNYIRGDSGKPAKAPWH
jgi:hypothetical protein